VGDVFLRSKALSTREYVSRDEWNLKHKGYLFKWLKLERLLFVKPVTKGEKCLHQKD